jgi:hypothetical protein
MKISFVIYFHSNRIKNLKQQLRFLRERENIESSEIILICQDEFKDEVYGIKPVNLGLNFYYKTKMCNIGVGLAKNRVIALLDSDRIFPENYFKKVFETINPSEFVSTWRMYKLTRDYSDKQIKENEIEKLEDFKSTENKPRTKNLFAGSTVFFKEDYLLSGGMDEGYEGYGFADTDMTHNIMSKNYKIIWNDDEELHLFHSKGVNWHGHFIELFPELSTSYNGIRYHKKWNLEMNEDFKFLINWAKKNFNKFPSVVQEDERFKSAFGPKKILL